MKVLVTGDTGYIGSVMVPMLVREGFDVTGVDADLFEDCIFEPPQRVARHINRDIADLTPADLEGYDAVFHLAALSNDPLGDLDPCLTYQINHHASLRLAVMAKQAGVPRFIFSSSCSLYGASGEDAVTETAPLNPITPYARSKAMLEWSLSALADSTFSPVFMRNATAYGVSPRMRFDIVLNNLTAWAVATGQVLIKSDGTPWRPIVHIEDITRAFIAAARAPREAVHDQAFNVGSEADNFRVSEIAAIVKETVSGCSITYAPGGEPDPRSYRVSFTKIQRLLPEFKPQWNARNGAEQLYTAFQRVGVDEAEFEGPKFRRISTLKKRLEQGYFANRSMLPPSLPLSLNAPRAAAE